MTLLLFLLFLTSSRSTYLLSDISIFPYLRCRCTVTITAATAKATPPHRREPRPREEEEEDEDEEDDVLLPLLLLLLSPLLLSPLLLSLLLFVSPLTKGVRKAPRAPHREARATPVYARINRFIVVPQGGDHVCQR